MARVKRTPYRTPKKSRTTGVVGRKAHRWKPGTGAIREIRKMQKRTDWLIRHEPFCRAVRSIAEEYRSDIRFRKDALWALHEDTEAYLAELFRDAYKITLLERMVTIMPRHLQAVRSFGTRQK